MDFPVASLRTRRCLASVFEAVAADRIRSSARRISWRVVAAESTTAVRDIYQDRHQQFKPLQQLDCPGWSRKARLQDM